MAVVRFIGLAFSDKRLTTEPSGVCAPAGQGVVAPDAAGVETSSANRLELAPRRRSFSIPFVSPAYYPAVVANGAGVAHAEAYGLELPLRNGLAGKLREAVPPTVQSTVWPDAAGIAAVRADLPEGS